MSRLRWLIGEIHRRSLWQVLGIYAVASWVIYQVVLALYEGIGLPDWVPGTSLVLLLVGLPIVLGTALIQEGPPAIRPDPDPARTQRHEAPGGAPARTRREDAGDAGSAHGGVRALFTWSKAVTGGVLAFAVLGLAATGFMGMRALGIGPAATLISSGELGDRTEVLVADFASPPADSLTASALAEAVRIDVRQSSALSVIDPAELGPALARMQREPGTALTEDVAVELAVREAIPLVLLGDLTPVGSGYQIAVRLIRSDSSRVLLTVRERATGPDDVLMAMDRLTNRLLERTGESVRSIRRAAPLAAFTTSSLEALRIYTAARRALLLENDSRKSEDLMEAALAEDSLFAMAWRGLGVVRSNLGDRAGTVEALTRAFELSDRLPPLERALAAAAYYELVEYEPDRLVDAYEQALAIDAQHSSALNNLGVTYADMGDFARGADFMARAVAADSSALSLGNLGNFLISAGDTARAWAVLETFRRRYPESASAPGLQRNLDYARGDVAALRANIDSVLGTDQRTGPRQFALWHRAMLDFREGRVRSAARTLEERKAERERAGWVVGGGGLLELAFVHILATGDTARGRELLDRFDEEVVPGQPALDRPHLPLATGWAMLGDLLRARRHLREWEQTVPEGVRRRDEPGRLLAVGSVALAEGRHDEALDHLRAATRRTTMAYLNHYFLARAYDVLGRADSALVAYRRFEETPHANRLYADAAFLGTTYERMAMLFEEQGDRNRAAEYYRRFIELWNDADPELQPRVEVARRALARLVGESTR